MFGVMCLVWNFLVRFLSFSFFKIVFILRFLREYDRSKNGNKMVDFWYWCLWYCGFFISFYLDFGELLFYNEECIVYNDKSILYNDDK